MASFTSATTPSGGPGHYTAQIPDRWQQGRGAFGGLVLGLLARTAERELSEPAWPLRTLNGEIFAPVLPEPAALKVETLREGSGTAVLEVRLEQGGELRARATGIFGKARVTDRELLGLAAPALGRFEDAEAVPYQEGLFPKFSQHLEFRPLPPLPFSGAEQPGAQGWVRFREAPPTLEMAELIALADSYWPATLAIEPEQRPMGTVSFTFEPLVDLAELDPKGPFAYRCTVPAAHDGYVVELRELWDARGQLLALNQQTFVIIK